MIKPYLAASINLPVREARSRGDVGADVKSMVEMIDLEKLCSFKARLGPPLYSPRIITGVRRRPERCALEVEHQRLGLLVFEPVDL